MSEQPRRPDGFTLIEILVVIVVLAVVATVITAVAAVILRTNGPTTVRADDSRTLHSINTWLAQDASATAPNNFTIPGNVTECSGLLGTSLVKMKWAQNTGTTVNYVANYRYVAQPNGNFRIVRYTCSGAGAGPYGNTAQIRLGSDLSPTMPTVSTVMNASSQVIGVGFEVFTVGGQSVFIDGDSRNPAATLPSTTSTTSTTTSTTSTTSTTVPTGPCALTNLVASPNPAPNQGNGIKRLQNPVTVTIQVSGICGTITLRYDRGDGNGLQTNAVSGTYPNYTVVLASSSSEEWSETNHPLQVFNGATLLNTTVYNLVVT